MLRTPCDRVLRFDAALARLVEDLMDTVQVPGRAGLAANQIGSSLAVFSYNTCGQLGYVINPVLTEASGSQDGPEACLSIPGVSAIRPRATRAVVTGVGAVLNTAQVPPGGQMAVVGLGGVAAKLIAANALDRDDLAVLHQSAGGIDIVHH